MECGVREFQDDVLKFYETIDDCLADGAVDVVLCSSVLQYLEQPYAVLEQFVTCGSPYLLIDRTAFIDGKRDRLMVQHAHFDHYDICLPAWFFSREALVSRLEHAGYSVKIEFACDDMANIESDFTGLLFQRNGVGGNGVSSV